MFTSIKPLQPHVILYLDDLHDLIFPPTAFLFFLRYHSSSICQYIGLIFRLIASIADATSSNTVVTL